MTIEKQEPGVWVAVCDDCGDRVELDTDPDDDFVDAVAEVKDLGWRCNRREIHRVTYWTHTCKDCL